MGKLLRVTDKILLGLAVFGDLLDEFEEIRPSKKKWHASVFGLMPHEYKKNNYLITVSRMLKNNTIEKVIENGVAKLRITSTGNQKISRNFPFLKFQKQKWDHKWRIVTFDIPEKKRIVRDRLRYKLKELGFGMLQKSIWISPHNFEDDIYEFFQVNSLQDNAYIFVSDKLLVGDNNSLVEKLWRISEINNMYKKAKSTNNTGLLVEALSRDPFLPRELLPNNWNG